MRKFKLEVHTTAVLYLDDSVIDQVDDEWRKQFYNLHTPNQIAAHIGENMATGSKLSQLDGWAHMNDAGATIRPQGVDVTATEEK